MENKEKKIGTATIDINEYDRLMKLEDKLLDAKEKESKNKAEMCEFFMNLINSFEDSHIINTTHNDSIMLNQMVLNAGYTVKINLQSGIRSIGAGKKIIEFKYE